MPRLDKDEPGLPAVEPAREVGAGMEMGMVEPESRGARRKRDAPHTMGGDKGRSLFRGAVHIRRQELPVPMQLFRRVGVIVDVDDDALSLRKTQQRPGKLAVIELGRDGCVRTEFDQAGADADRILRRFVRGRYRGLRRGTWRMSVFRGLRGLRSGDACCERRCPAEPE